MAQFRFKYLVPLAIGVLALFFPLLRDFHLESAIAAATIGAFWAGITAAKEARFHKYDVRRALDIAGMLYLAALPLLINALITGCYTVHGLGFWLLIPLPSVFFGYAIGRLFRELNVPYPKLWAVVVLFIIALGEWAYEFFSLPQLYFFNHVWGWWPGPIYDEAVQLNGALAGFRFITLCWILILWLVPELKRHVTYRWIVGLAAAGLALSYIQLERTGIITPDEYLQQRLGGSVDTGHVRIYYARAHYSDREIDRLATEMEFYISQIKEALRIDLPDSTRKIACYLYAHPWQKKQLVGAKYTSYVTIWKETPQIHIAKEQIEGSMKHEVVHAVTALLEGPGLLPNIGLTEGIAVALDPDRSPESTIDQLVAAKKPYPSTEEMRSALSLWGFYTGRSAVSYTTTGSFVRYLIERYPPGQFVRAYETGQIEHGYTSSFGELVAGWHRMLDSVAVDSSDRRRASEIFGRPSLFERHCPHKVSAAAELFDRYLYYSAVKDTSKTIAMLAELKERAPEEPFPKLLWTVWNLRAGRTDPVIEQANLADTLIDLQLLYSDAYILEGRQQQAQSHLHRAIRLAAQRSDTTYDNLFANRLDPNQWAYDLRIRFERARLEPEVFAKAYYLLKIRSVRNALQADDDRFLAEYARHLASLPASMEYFGTYLSMIHRLAYNRDFTEAESWIQKLEQHDPSLRYRERLQQEREWLRYMRLE